jgi:Flp pilus assembly pilin Flp
MCDVETVDAGSPVNGAREAGAAMIEYIMLLGFITSLIVFLFALLYPSAGKDIETLVNQWGNKIATEIAGDKISKDNDDAWGAN